MFLSHLTASIMSSTEYTWNIHWYVFSLPKFKMRCITWVLFFCKLIVPISVSQNNGRKSGVSGTLVVFNMNLDLHIIPPYIIPYERVKLRLLCNTCLLYTSPSPRDGLLS